MRNAQRADRVSLRSIRGALACVVQHQLYQFTIGGGAACAQNPNHTPALETTGTPT